MAPKRSKPILRQEDFLYDLEWDVKFDNYFIEVLEFESRAGNIRLGCANEVAIFTAQEAMLTKFRKFFSFKQLCKKLRLLEQRFTTFKWMLSLEGVDYVPATNVVTFSDATWKYIVQENNFAWAYATYGENKFDELKSIFGDEPFPIAVAAPADADNDVIVLSSDDDEPPNDGFAPLFAANNVVHRNPLEDARGGRHFDIIHVSSDTSERFENDVMNFINGLSESQNSRDTEVSTANSRDNAYVELEKLRYARKWASCSNRSDPDMEPNSSTGSNKPPVAAKKK